MLGRSWGSCAHIFSIKSTISGHHCLRNPDIGGLYRVVLGKAWSCSKMSYLCFFVPTASYIACSFIPCEVDVTRRIKKVRVFDIPPKETSLMANAIVAFPNTRYRKNIRLLCDYILGADAKVPEPANWPSQQGSWPLISSIVSLSLDQSPQSWLCLWK